MTHRAQSRQQRLRGLKALVHDAVELTTELVADGFESTARNVKRVTDRIEPLAGPVQALDVLRLKEALEQYNAGPGELLADGFFNDPF